MPPTPTHPVSNAAIAELLARAAETAKMPLQKALRRASRKALFWPEEAASLLQQGRSLTELEAVGPSLSKIIQRWFDSPPESVEAPDIRRGFLTLTAARALLAKQPAASDTVLGDLQMHTRWSDGSGEIEDMARAGIERGYQYVAITDHTQGLKIAGGINEVRLREQANEIDSLNERLRSEGLQFRVLKSAELNLDVAGRGDMDSEALRALDIVLGCFHSALRRKDDQTKRYVAALRNPDIQILGHPRGRIYNFRLGLTADWERVFSTAAEMDKAVEIDGYPDRQDLNIDLLKLARTAGCRISLGTDAHDPQQLRFMEYSLAAVVASGIRQDRVLNFMAAEDLLDWVRAVRSRR